jgi:hypothetical protein
LAQVATVTGDHERALLLVRDIPGASIMSREMTWLVRAAVADGDHERARKLVAEISESYRDKAQAFLSGAEPAVPGLYVSVYPSKPVIGILLAAGDRERALTIVRDIAFDSQHSALASMVVDAEIAAGNRDRALDIAYEIPPPADRAAALSRVVESAAAASDAAKARSLLAEVLLSRRWYESVALMARVAPDALVPVLDELASRCEA